MDVYGDAGAVADNKALSLSSEAVSRQSLSSPRSMDCMEEAVRLSPSWISSSQISLYVQSKAASAVRTSQKVSPSRADSMDGLMRRGLN